MAEPASRDDTLLPTRLIVCDSELLVEWAPIQRASLSLPFFGQAIEASRKAVAAIPPRVTPLSQLLRAPKDADLRQRLSGIIFNLSHSGSTLLSNAIGTSPSTLVFKEPHVLCDLLKPRFDRWVRHIREDLVDAVLQAFEHYALRHNASCVIKLHSWNYLYADVLCGVAPNTRTVRMIRHPLEVAASNLEKPPGWMRYKRDPIWGAEVLGWPATAIAAMSDEEFVARVIARFLAAAKFRDDQSSLLVDYGDLSSNMIIQVSSFLGAPTLSDSGIDAILRIYSKDPEQKTAFSSDSAVKRRGASRTLRTAIERHAMGPYEELRQHRFHCPPCMSAPRREVHEKKRDTPSIQTPHGGR